MLITCTPGRAAVFVMPGLLDTLVAGARRNDGSSTVGCVAAFLPLKDGLAFDGGRARLWAADAQLLSGAVRSVAGAERGQLPAPERMWAFQFLVLIITWTVQNDPQRFYEACATPGLPLALARLLAGPQDTSASVRPVCAGTLSTMLLSTDDGGVDTQCRRRAAATLAAAPGGLEVLLSMLSHPDAAARASAGECLLGASAVKEARAQLLKAPAALPVLLGVLERLPRRHAAAAGAVAATPQMDWAARFALRAHSQELQQFEESKAQAMLVLHVIQNLADEPNRAWLDQLLQLCAPPAGSGDSAALRGLACFIEDLAALPSELSAASRVLMLVCHRAAAPGWHHTLAGRGARARPGQRRGRRADARGDGRAAAGVQARGRAPRGVRATHHQCRGGRGALGMQPPAGV